MNKSRYIAIAFLFFFAIQAEAQTCIANTGSGNWTDASTWSCGVVPTNGSYDNIVIPAGATVLIQNGETVSFTDSVFVEIYGTLTVGESGGGGTATLALANDLSSLQVYTGGLIDGTNKGQIIIGVPPGFTLLPGPQVEDGFDGPQSITPDGPGEPLPVELAYFKARVTQNGVLLNWQTAIEFDNDFFEIETSQDGENFTPIAKIAGAGFSNSTINYDWLHKSPAVGLNYYRLKQVDFNGDFEYFETVLVKNENPVHLYYAAYPQPATSIVTLDIHSSDYDYPIKLNLYNVLGEVQLTEIILSEERKVQLDISKYNSGLYLIQLEQSNSIFNGKLLIQH